MLTGEQSSVLTQSPHTRPWAHFLGRKTRQMGVMFWSAQVLFLIGRFFTAYHTCWVFFSQWEKFPPTFLVKKSAPGKTCCNVVVICFHCNKGFFSFVTGHECWEISVFNPCFKKNKIFSNSKNVRNPKFSVSFTLSSTAIKSDTKRPKFSDEKQNDTVFLSLIARNQNVYFLQRIF